MEENRVEESIEIARAPAFVWDFLADPLNDPRWCSKVKSVEPVAELRWRVLHKPVPLRPPMELILEHLQLQRPERLTLRQEDDASIFDVEYRLLPSGDGTRFTQISVFAWKRLPRLLGEDVRTRSAPRRAGAAARAEAATRGMSTARYRVALGRYSPPDQKG